jgi:hypothetical protein
MMMSAQTAKRTAKVSGAFLDFVQEIACDRAPRRRDEFAA